MEPTTRRARSTGNRLAEQSKAAYEIAREVIEGAALTTVHTSIEMGVRVARRHDISVATARKWLDRAVELGTLRQLKPQNDWSVVIPGVTDPRFANIYGLRIALVRDPDTASRENHYEVRMGKFDRAQEVYHRYQPGRLVFLSTPGRVEEIARGFIEQVDAEEKARLEESEARDRARTAEINRREPGLLDLLAEVHTALGEDPNEARAWLRGHLGADVEVNEQKLGCAVTVRTPQGVTVLREILRAGLDARKGRS